MKSGQKAHVVGHPARKQSPQAHPPLLSLSSMQPMSTQRQIFYSFHQDALSINVRPNKNGGVTDERA
jgi:hypothetical protein